MIAHFKRIARFILKKVLPQNVVTSRIWGKTNTAEDSAYWWNFTVVREIMYSWVTGDSKLSWFTQQIRNRRTPFGRVLAFGDGDGMAAEAALTRNDTLEVIYLNLSKGECKRFKQLFDNHHFNFSYHFLLGDANHFSFGSLGMFDTIISVGAFHHFFNFEKIFPQLNQILNKHGLMYVDEFIGPTKMQYNTQLVNQLNLFLQSLPDELILNRSPLSQEDFPKLWKNSLDQSECIRSSELDNMLRQNFEIVDTRPFGGTLLQPLFLTSYLSPPRLNVSGWRETEIGQNELRKIAYLEKEWISSGKIPAHYMYYLCRKKKD